MRGDPDYRVRRHKAALGGKVAGKPLRIGLLWHSANSGNLGVGALTLAHLQLVREVAQGMGFTPRFTIVGMRDSGPSYVHDPDVDVYSLDTRRLFSPGGYARLLKDLDCVLDIGAGDSFAEIYGWKRFTFMWLSKMLTVRRGVPLLLAPQTIGPFTRQPYVRLARMAMDRARVVVARDKPSLDAIRALAPNTRAMLATDVAFALPFRPASPDQGRRKIGINVSGLLFADSEAGRDQFRLGFDYARLTRALLTALSRRDDLEIHLVTHTTEKENPADDDGRACDRMAIEFPNAVRVRDFTDPSDAKSYLSGLDMLVAARMHACIGAASAGVPVVPIAYSRKFAGVFGSLGYEWLVPAAGMDTDQALAFILDCIDRRSELKQDLDQAMARVSELLDLYRGELRKLFETVA